MSDFIHLHTHSHYSLLNALPKIDDLVNEAKKHGMKALALTDAGNLYGAIDFYKTCKKKEIKPILGVDFYVAARTRKDMQAGIDNKRSRLVLLAKNHDGYKNLIKLVTLSHLEGFYYKPRIDEELIKTYKENLICISPSFTGEIALAIKNKNKEKAIAKINFYKSVYGKDNFYLEITRHPEIPNHEPVMKDLIALAKETNTQIVAGHDVYYIHPEDREARDTLVLVNTLGDASDKRDDNEDEDFSLISGEKAEELFSDIPKAISNTKKIADECNIEITLGKWIFPNYVVESGLSYDEELRRIVFLGIEKRGMERTKEVLDRIEYELKVIQDKGYSQYFLVVWDLLHYSHDHGILTNIRGSVAGSLTTYLAGITNVDPLEYKLPFERFLNPERPSAPDIDMDFADNRRDEVIEYARNKYGHDKVAQIGTFGTMMARGAVRDVARSMGYPYEIGDKISKLIPMGAQGFPMTIDKALADVPELKEMYEKEADVKRIIDMAKKIEGCARHISVHAAGVVIAPTPLIEHVPLQYDTKGEKKIITQYDMHDVGEDGIGLLKFDFLGIKNLSILADAVDRVKKIENIDVDIENIPLDDKKTFEMLARGETTGLFQLNGSGMTRFLIDLKPTSIHDINAMVALYRPGPLEMIPVYIERKHDPSKVEYLDPRMKDILDRSYGVITYQDDVMMIAIKLAGYSWLEADKLRKAMGKKIPKEMAEQKDKLLSGFKKGGLSDAKGKKLWALIEPFAAYGFNKCLTGDTLITDSNTGRRISIEELYKSNKQISIQSMNSSFKLESVPIGAVLENGIKDTFIVKTRSGRKIKATSNHPLYTFNGWVNIENLKVGTKIATNRNLQIKSAEIVSPFMYKAATLGYLISEGNLCHPHGAYYYSSSKDEVNDFISVAEKFENNACTINTSKSAISVYCGQKNKKIGNTLFNWIDLLGLKGKKATEKFIPDEIFAWSRMEQAIFIGKLWQGDGCVSIKNVQLYYATSSEKLAYDIQHLLLRFSILSTIHVKNFKYRGGIKIGYTVNITHRDNINKFNIEFGAYLVGKKNNDLIKLNDTLRKVDEIKARGTKDVIPAPILSVIREEMKNKNITVKEVSKMTGLHERLFGKDARKIGYQRPVISKIAKHLDSKLLMDYANSDIYWDEIVSIESGGKTMTYDLSVPPHHNFVANDIIVHNSHAASYGRVAYQTSYLKANFPAIYMSSVLTADSGDVEKIAEVVAECKRMNIPILPPDINESFSQFTVVKDTLSNHRIRFGLVTIKNFGQGIATAIIDERKKNGKFKSLVDFLDRVKDKNLNKKSLEALIKSGALDSFGIDRGVLIANIETLLEYNKERAKESKNQDSLFGLMSDATTLPTLRLQEAPNVSPKERLGWEKELLGLYVSGHPLDNYRATIEKNDIDIKKIKERSKANDIVMIACIVEEEKPIATKDGNTMLFIKLADFSGTMEAVVFPRTLAEFRTVFTKDACVAVKGKVSERKGEKSIIVERAKRLA